MLISFSVNKIFEIFLILNFMLEEILKLQY